VGPNINRLFSESASKLRNIRHYNVIERPEQVLINFTVTLLKPYLDTIGEKIILTQQIFLLYAVV
jgi:hypothetical protein